MTTPGTGKKKEVYPSRTVPSSYRPLPRCSQYPGTISSAQTVNTACQDRLVSTEPSLVGSIAQHSSTDSRMYGLQSFSMQRSAHVGHTNKKNLLHFCCCPRNVKAGQLGRISSTPAHIGSIVHPSQPCISHARPSQSCTSHAHPSAPSTARDTLPVAHLIPSCSLSVST